MKRTPRTDLPERVQYTKYYEHDGMLRAYANRSMVLAILFAVIAMSSLGFAIYVRVQPPTVVRVDQDGNATAVGAAVDEGKPAPVTAQAAGDTSPSELEAKAVVRRFSGKLPGLHAGHGRSEIWRQISTWRPTNPADLLARASCETEDTVGKIKEDRIISQFQIRTIEPVKNAFWTYVAFGVKRSAPRAQPN